MNILKIHLIGLILLIPFSAQAFFMDNWFDVQVINEVNVSASTGGNTAESGQVIEGEANVEVHIESNINGESIDPIDIVVESEPGEDAKVEVSQEIVYPDEEAEPKVEREIKINEEVEDILACFWDGIITKLANLFGFWRK
jgi:predicted secreted protein